MYFLFKYVDVHSNVGLDAFRVKFGEPCSTQHMLANVGYPTKKSTKSKLISPAPPEMYETLQKMGYSQYQPVNHFFHEQYHLWMSWHPLGPRD